jgi:hypothetical protein
MLQFKKFINEVVMTGKATDGRSNLQKYVLDNPKALEIEWEIESKKNPAIVYDDEMEETQQVQTGTKFKLKNREVRIVGRTKYLNTTLGWIRLGVIKKPSGFKAMSAEIEQTNRLNQEIQKAISLNGDNPINIKIGKWLLKDIVVADRDRIKRDPKADVALIDINGAEVGFISLKKSGGAKGFSQYSGISIQSGILNKKIDDFIDSVFTDVGKTAKKGYAVYRPIKDKKLINQSIYGPDYGGKFGRENVHCIGQGEPLLIKKKGFHELDFTEHMGLNGDVSWAMTGTFTACFGATFRNGRQMKSKANVVKHCRGGIYPIAYLTSRKQLKEI